MKYEVRLYNHYGDMSYDIFFGVEWITRFVGYNAKARAEEYCARLNQAGNYK